MAASSNFSLSKAESVAFASSCYSTVKNTTGKRITGGPSLSFTVGVDPKPKYEHTDFFSEGKYSYYPPTWINSTSYGAYFETTIVVAIRREYHGDGWTLKDKSELIKQSYICLSKSKKRGAAPEVVEIYTVRDDEFNVWSSYMERSKCNPDCNQIELFAERRR
jgi:hypothetical protein